MKTLYHIEILDGLGAVRLLAPDLVQQPPHLHVG